jgi:hypothetical protein
MTQMSLISLDRARMKVYYSWQQQHPVPPRVPRQVPLVEGQNWCDSQLSAAAARRRVIQLC